MRRLIIVTVCLTVLVTGCSGDGTEDASTLTVLAASSLTDAFPEIGDAFSAQHEGVDVRFSFAGSQELVAQAGSGAPADVLALAGTGSLDTLESATSDPVVFARNELTIIVPAGNPADVDSIEDLAATDVKVALAGPEVPAGTYAAEAFDKAQITVEPVSEETEVKAVVTRVAVGGADAGVVYVTDASASDADIESISIPAKYNVVASYPAVSLRTSGQSGLAEEFVQFLTGDQAQQILESYGFAPA